MIKGTMRICEAVLLVTVIFTFCHPINAQGPRSEYFHNTITELSWASGNIYLEGGSQQKINFTPLISSNGSPYGTEKYSKNISLDGHIYFVGNGIVDDHHNSYQNLEVEKKIVMFCYDFPDTINLKIETSSDLKRRISEALKFRVTGIVLFSYQRDAPFLAIRDTLLMIDNEVPIITINRITAENIFYSAGKNPEGIFDQWKSGNIPKSERLITKIRVEVKGKFEKIESEHFLIRFREENIPVSQMKTLIDTNNESVKFILNLFSELNPYWRKSFIAYFSDYDSKLFYTRHWGFGWSTDNGVFMVYNKELPGFGLAVHENTHTLFRSNWGGQSSFMNEGVAMHAEAMATGKDKNHLKTAEFLKENQLYRLSQMLDFDIGRDEAETEIGYPASGSFIQYIIETYGLEKFFDKWKVAEEWDQVYGLSVKDMERQWLEWLSRKYKVENEYVLKHFEK